MSVLDKSFFLNNRERVYDELEGGLLVVPGYTRMQRSHDMAARFEQESNFWYLCGIEEPDWILIMDARERSSWLVAPTVSKHHELFDGSLSHGAAQKISGIKDIIDEKAADNLLKQYARHHQLVYYVGEPPHSDSFGFTLNPTSLNIFHKLETIFKKLCDFRSELSRIRSIKQPIEIEMIRAAVDLTIEGFELVRQQIETYKFEYEIESDFTHIFRRSGATGHAYDPIVASGRNACTLHYINNNSPIQKNELLLMDVGARVGGYAADITRTYAIEKPTKRQIEVHNAVKMAHEQIVDLVTPGLELESYQKQVNMIMSDALISLKLISGKNDEKYSRYFPHSISHGLGIDVHDQMGQPKKFLTGMVITVEPGIYIPEEGIGVRIEDDILITIDANENLSAKLLTHL